MIVVGLLFLMMGWASAGPVPVVYYSRGDNFASQLSVIGTKHVEWDIGARVTISANTTIPSNIHLRMVDSSLITPTHATDTLFINGPFDAGFFQCFAASVAVKFSDSNSIAAANPKWWGARGNGINFDRVPIQRAINAFTEVLLPKGRYRLDSTLSLRTKSHLRGAGRYASLLQTNAGDSVAIMLVGNATDSVEICDLGFENYGNYPNDQTTSANTGIFLHDTLTFKVNSAIRFKNSANATYIHDCYFHGITGSSIRYEQTSTTTGFKNILIKNNHFLYGSYILDVIRIQAGNTDTARTNDVIVSDNILDRSSCQKYVLPGISPRDASNDGILIYRCRNFHVTGNEVNFAGGVGIRIERSTDGEVACNKIRESGHEGIAVYNSCFGVGVIGNFVRNWGAIPAFDNLRTYSGRKYLAREAAVSGVVNLPANPSTTPWFVENPYYLGGTDTSKVPAYSVKNYYNDAVSFLGLPDGGDITNSANFDTATDQGILPFRGYGGIAVNQLSEGVAIVGNHLYGSLDTAINGKYTHASDFGISTVHPINFPTSYKSPMVAYANQISGVITAEVYQPPYVDSINSRGPISSIIQFASNYGINAATGQLTELPFSFPKMWVTGTTQLTGNTSIGEGVGAPQVFINGAASTLRGIEIQQAGKTEWYLYAPTTPVRANLSDGDDLAIASYDSGGAFIENALRIQRLSGGVMSTKKQFLDSNTTDATSTTAASMMTRGGLGVVKKSFFGDVVTFLAGPKFGGTNATGAGSAALGANSPASTLTAPYTWIQVTTSDGSTAYMPAWK